MYGYGLDHGELGELIWGEWIQMGMEQAQHTPLEMAWKNNGKKLGCLTESKRQKVTKSVLGESFTMYLQDGPRFFDSWYFIVHGILTYSHF